MIRFCMETMNTENRHMVKVVWDAKIDMQKQSQISHLREVEL